MKIMVTGSRDWPHSKSFIIGQTLLEYSDKTPQIIVGDCPTGVDLYTKQFASQHSWPIDIYEADWLRLGRAAGPIRNSAMVKDSPDICIAFMKNGSRGTANAVSLAKKAGIPVVQIDYDTI